MPSRERTNLLDEFTAQHYVKYTVSGNSETGRVVRGNTTHIICTGYTNPRAQARAVSRVCVSYPYRARDAVSPEIRARDS